MRLEFYQWYSESFEVASTLLYGPQSRSCDHCGGSDGSFRRMPGHVRQSSPRLTRLSRSAANLSPPAFCFSVEASICPDAMNCCCC